MNMIKNTLVQFSKEEDGLALTEYLILLGLLTGVVIGAVVAFGGGLGENWDAWGDWMAGADLAPDAELTGVTPVDPANGG